MPPSLRCETATCGGRQAVLFVIGPGAAPVPYLEYRFSRTKKQTAKGCRPRVRSAGRTARATPQGLSALVRPDWPHRKPERSAPDSTRHLAGRSEVRHARLENRQTRQPRSRAARLGPAHATRPAHDARRLMPPAPVTPPPASLLTPPASPAPLTPPSSPAPLMTPAPRTPPAPLLPRTPRALLTRQPPRLRARRLPAPAAPRSRRPSRSPAHAALLTHARLKHKHPKS